MQKHMVYLRHDKAQSTNLISLKEAIKITGTCAYRKLFIASYSSGFQDNTGKVRLGNPFELSVNI